MNIHIKLFIVVGSSLMIRQSLLKFVKGLLPANVLCYMVDYIIIFITRSKYNKHYGKSSQNIINSGKS